MNTAPKRPTRLYTYAMSPFAAKVHCCLLYKSLDFECLCINPLRVKRDLPVGWQIPVVTADDGLPVRESKRKLYDEFLAQLGDGPFLGGRDEPSLPDLAAYPQFARYYLAGFRGGDGILERPALMEWLVRMRDLPLRSSLARLMEGRAVTTGRRSGLGQLGRCGYAPWTAAGRVVEQLVEVGELARAPR